MVQCSDRFSLFDQIPIGICVLQSDYRVIFWNQCLEEWTNIPRDRIHGQSIREFCPHFQQAIYVHRLTPIFAGGPPTIFSSQLHPHIIPSLFAEGQPRVQHTTVTAIPADGEGFYAMLSIQDVTDLTFRVQEYRQMRDRAISEAKERQLAQEQAEAANRYKDEFLAIVSHELRTPLNPILGWSKLLREGKLEAVEVDRALETIERNAVLQTQLIDDLLDVSRILRGTLTLNWQITDIALIAHAALDTICLMAENKGITLHCYPTGAALVRGDTTRLQQVVWNLLTNAIKFTEPGGRVTVTIRSDSKCVMLSVQDTGIGIAADFLPYIFDPFRQADGSITRKIGGLGLGLAITRHLVELHGGSITAESVDNAQGSTFTVYLPVLETHTPPQSQPTLGRTRDALPSLSGLHILVVDDEPDALELARFILEGSGAVVITVDSVLTAIAFLETNLPNLIVSDLGMPDQDGFNLMHWVRSRPDQISKIPAIALTAYASKGIEQESLTAGFHHYLAKPLDPDELIHLASELTIQSNSQ
jgi:signal transduction histidine kinase/ActR/RegA family two-component response regulator